MIMSGADNLMIGDDEIAAVYCGDALIWERGSLRPVPAGYEALEHFDTGGTYACNTLFKPTSGILNCECKIEPKVSVAGDAIIVGGFNADPASLKDQGTIWLLQKVGNRASVKMRGSYGTYETQSAENSFTVGMPIVISGTFSPSTSITVGGITTTGSGGAVLQRDVWITGNGAYNQANACNAYIYYFKFWDGDTLARDMVPVKRLSDNKNGMWDFVTESFYVFA